jgi:hypothetical protein
LVVALLALGGTALVAQINPSTMPVGSVVKGFVMPQRNAQGDLQSNITGETATIVSPNRTVITGLKVEMYDAAGKTITTTITAPQCDFWPLERRLSGHHGVVIDRPEAHITAEDVDWDFKTQTAVLHKNVHVVLSRFAVGKPAASASTPTPAPAAAH